MKTFACRECQSQVRRPTAPLKCEACGAQRIGLFKEVTAPQKPAAGGGPAPADTATPPAPPVVQPEPPPLPPKSAPPAAPPRAAPPRPQAAPPVAVSTPAAGQTRPPAPASPPVPARAPEKAPAAPRKSSPPSPGALLWRYPVHVPGQEMATGALRNCPALDDQGRVYLAIGPRVVALVPETEDARILWQYKTAGPIPGSPSIGADGRIRVHSKDTLLYCLTDAGEPAFTPAEVGQPLGWASPVVDQDGNTWICNYTGGLLKVDARGIRKQAPFFRSRQKFDSTPVIRDQLLYVGAEDGFVYCVALDGTRGMNRWDHVADCGKTQWYINSSPALCGDTLYVAGRDEYLYAFDLDGRERWKLHLRGQMLASPIVAADGSVYVGVSLLRRGESDQGKLVKVHGTTHRVEWEFRAAASVESTPVLGDDGVVYFGDNSGRVMAVDAEGRQQWTAELGSAIRTAGTIAAGGRLLLGSEDGTLCCLKCSSKALASSGWPKYMGSSKQSGTAPA